MAFVFSLWLHSCYSHGLGSNQFLNNLSRRSNLHAVRYLNIKTFANEMNQMINKQQVSHANVC